MLLQIIFVLFNNVNHYFLDHTLMRYARQVKIATIFSCRAASYLWLSFPEERVGPTDSPVPGNDGGRLLTLQGMTEPAILQPKKLQKPAA